MTFSVRRVVTGVDAHGNAVFVSDGAPPRLVEAPDGTAVAELWTVPGPPRDPSDGGDGDGPFRLEPEPGGLWWRLIRLPPPDPSRPIEEQFFAPRGLDGDGHKRGMHRTRSLDLMLVVDGRIELEVDADRCTLGAGDCVVQRGTMHRWRVLDGVPCTYLTAMFAVDPEATPPSIDLAPRAPPAATGHGPRRVVTGVEPSGRSIVLTDGEAPTTVVFEHGAGMLYSNLWETGGPLASPLQGGDPPSPYLQLDPLGMGVSWKYLIIPPDRDRRTIDGAKLRAEMAERAAGMASTGHHDPQDPGNHRTDTIDLDYILEGDVELELPGHGSVRLWPGDAVVQRGNWHKWHNRGDTPMRMIAILVGAPIGGLHEAG